jgi:hypothetical protein
MMNVRVGDSVQPINCRGIVLWYHRLNVQTAWEQAMHGCYVETGKPIVQLGRLCYGDRAIVMQTCGIACQIFNEKTCGWCCVHDLQQVK